MKKSILQPIDVPQNGFRAKIEEIQERLLKAQGGSEADLLAEAMESLQISFEELCVAEEEMRVQNEELIAVNQKLHAEHQRYLELFDLAPDGYMVTDLDGIIQEANLAAARLLNVRREFLAGKPMLIYINEQDRRTFDSWLTSLMQGKNILGREIGMQPRDGTPFPAALSLSLIHNDDGKSIGLRWQLRDISERKRVEITLAESEKKLKALFNLLPIGVSVIDAERNIVDVNPALEKILGMSRNELLRNENRIRRYLRPDGTEMTFEEIPSVRAFNEQAAIKNVEIGAVKENGDIIWMEVSAVPLPSLDWRVVIITSDITERKRAEEALQKAKEDLKDKVKERTEELRIINRELRAEIGEHEKTEVELEKSKEIAEEAARAKASFMANMSHEIRTPMNAVIGMTSLLLEEDLTSDQRDFVETIRSGGDALLAIINDILDFSRLEKEKTELETQAFYLRRTLEEALDLVAAKAAEKKLNLAYTIEKNSPEMIIGDPIRLRQILANLLDNAVKFTDDGEILLSVSSKPSDKRFEFHFAIRDSGIGIPPYKIDHLFESFQQVDDSITRKYGGTGLGLAISKKLVELMGGSIWLESKMGQGSTFHFIILVDVVPGKHAAEMVQVRLKGKRILIVEDNKTNRYILESQVLQWGMVPTIIGSSREALRLIDGGDDFDIAILEMDMPEMDGLALAKEIRRRNSVIPLVMLTFLGKGTGSDLFDAVITKPIKPSQLHNVLIDILPGKFSNLPVVETIKSDTGFKPQRILLAEDNVSNQKVIAQMLKKLGLGADIVANGVEALQALERQHYDLVLMDVRMPEMDGLDATRIIRRLWQKNKPTIIAITAYGLEGDREKCLESGMDDYISKPVKLEDLRNVLNKYAYKSEKAFPERQKKTSVTKEKSKRSFPGSDS